MTPTVLAVPAESSLRLLAEASLRAAAMVAATAIVLTLFGVRDARVRHAAWTGMLVFMLLSPLAIAWGPRAAAFAIDWRVIASALYVVVVFVLCVRIAIGIHRVRRLLRGAIPQRDYLIHPACSVPGRWRRAS